MRAIVAEEGGRCAFVASILAVAAFAVPTPAWALRPCGPPPAAELVWPGWSDPPPTVAGGAALLLRLHVPARSLGGVWLAPAKGGGKRIPLRLEPAAELKLHFARLPQAIARGTYDVWVRAPQPRRGGPPSSAGELDELKLYPQITVGRGGASGRPPALRAPAVRFGPWGPADTDMRRLRRAGRDVTLVFTSRGGRSAPAFVVVRGAYDDGQERHEVLEVQPYGKQVQIGSTSSARCATRYPLLTPAPKQGTYALSITPWSATGVKGPPVQLSGRVR